MGPSASGGPMTLAKRSIPCPSCGAPARFPPSAVSLVCEFCDSTLVRTGVDIRLVGKVSALVDRGSPILLGSHGRTRNMPFTVVGRLQVTYARGTWSEWYLEFGDGSTGWLTDALGHFAIMRQLDPQHIEGRVPRFDAINVGMMITVDNTTAIVVDKRAASYRGAEGILPFVAEPGITFHGVDLHGYGGEFLSLDYRDHVDHDRPVGYAGYAVALADLRLHPVRAFQGWTVPRH